MICKYCGNKLDDNSNICLNCGMSSEYINVSFGSKFVSCIFPLVGICMFFMLKFKKDPNAHTILRWTFLGILLWTILYAIAFFMGIILIFQI